MSNETKWIIKRNVDYIELKPEKICEFTNKEKE